MSSHSLRCRVRGVLAIACCLACVQPIAALDWPQPGFDAGHTASTPEALPAQLHLQWVWHLAPLTPAWPDQPRLDYDAVYRPLIVGERMILASPRDDSLAAYDLASGAECWRFFTGGPIRLAPASDGVRIFAGSDDGWIYAVSADRGSLLWKFKGAPKSRRIVGNGRLIDTWCVRGGPVVADGQVYFAAGIWPFMGVFLHCLDAASGKPVWSNSGDGATYTLQPHGAGSFGGIAPQGTLAVAGEDLLVPGGRTLPACYDRRTGKQRYFELNTKTGSHAVVAADRYFYCAGTAYELSSGRACNAPLPGPAKAPTDVARWCSIPENRPSMRSSGSQAPWIVAGNRLYVGGNGRVAGFDQPGDRGRPPAWQTPVEGAVGAMAAGNQHLLVSTDLGRVYCFAFRATQPRTLAEPPAAPLAAAEQQRADWLLKDSGRDAGYALLWGAAHGELARAMAARSGLHIVVVEPDPAQAQRLREVLQDAELYGERIAVCVGDLESLALPPYFASLAVLPDPFPLAADAKWAERLFRVLHPYHGRAYCKLAAPQRRQLNQFAGSVPGKSHVTESDGWTRLVRSGGLPGAGNWTHEHADAANTRFSADVLVKAPLGLLWFGGSSHEGVLPRHGHGPQPQVLDGQLVIEKVDGLRAMDIYTGRVLWEADLPGLGAYYNNTAHQHGANGTGTNYISAQDAIYVRYGAECLRLDPASGKTLSAVALPAGSRPSLAEGAIWGYLNVAGEYLIGGVAMPEKASPLFRWTALSRSPAQRGSSGAAKGGFSSSSGADNAAASAREVPQAIESHSLFVMHKRTGQVLWSVPGKGRFRHNAICVGGGRLYAIERPQGRITAFDLASGKVLWAEERGVFGTWLSYSADHDVLVEAGFASADTLRDEPRGMRAYRGRDGRPLWHDAQASGPPLLHDDWVLRDFAACGLLDGKPLQVGDPLSGEPRPWRWTRAHGCNIPAGSEHLLTFRSGAAGFYDLARCGGTGNWGGFRSSCTNNLIVAGGLLTVPDYTRTCTCSYQNQTSLALCPDPDAEMWTYQASTAWPAAAVRRLGVNFGAPGNRVDDHGTLWQEYPRVAGGATGGTIGWPQLQVAPELSQLRLFRQHASAVEGPLPWICASGMAGVQSVQATLSPSAQPQRYTVRLYFADPEDLPAGQRPFDVAIQGRPVLSGFDVIREAGAARRGLVKEFGGIVVEGRLVITLQPRGSRPAILSGLEVVAESESSSRVVSGKKEPLPFSSGLPCVGRADRLD